MHGCDWSVFSVDHLLACGSWALPAYVLEKSQLSSLILRVYSAGFKLKLQSYEFYLSRHCHFRILMHVKRACANRNKRESPLHFVQAQNVHGLFFFKFNSKCSAGLRHA